MLRLGALMRRLDSDGSPPDQKDSRDWGVAAAIAISIVICLAAFVWIFVELDPFMDDFTGSNATVTSDPSASPIEATEVIDID
jgi:hypothetical protein